MAKVSLRAYNQEIETMIDRGHLDEAIAHCRHILKTFPKYIETYRLLGKAYLEYKRYGEAADIFSRVLAAVPNDFVANVGMSIIRDEENHLDDAIWHMERAFETQPSNAAIQSELQRLYARREGVAPPRIRMTRGALAHMYVQGELYPQAISEIKSVLKEDAGRHDMQVLLARAYYRSGLKNDAADVASTVLRTQPYNLDANRVLVEILGIDHPESVLTYRQRVVELDPYAAQVTGSIFTSSEVPDPAVTLEHLDWNGQPVGLQPDWQERQAISLESPALQDDQPDWLKSALGETPLTSPQVNPFEEMPSRSAPFDAAPPSIPPAERADDIPDFLREAGWGKSTGAFDESKSAFADAEREPAALEPIEQGDLPDWVKAMAPQQTPETPAEEEEELPDWINQIGTSALPVPTDTSDQLDWMNPPSETPAQPVEDKPDWLKQLDAPEQAAASPQEEPDWLKGFGSETESTSAAPAGDLDWLNQLGQTEGTEAKPVEPLSDEFDFLNRPSEPFDAAPSAPAAETFDLLGESEAQSEGAAPSSSADDFDFLDPLGSPRSTTPATADEFDFLNELTQEGEQSAPSATPESSSAASLGKSEEEQDDAFAWLESLAAKQGATEGLLTKPEERLEEEPDWVKQAKGVDVPPPPAETAQPSVAEPAANIEELGKSEQEQDDSFAWLESLAAKQGATEGLLTKPEERLEEEPEWVQQAKTLSTQSPEVPPAQPPAEERPPVAEPAAGFEELGKSEQEQDDSFAWLESLAAKQGASEGLLTKPEERPEEEPEWVKQAKDIGESPALASASEQPADIDQTEVWLRNLEGREVTSEPEERSEEKPDWLQQADQTPAEESSFAEAVSQEPASMDDTAIWLKSLDAETVAPQASEATEETPAWMQEGQGLPAAEPVAEEDDTEAWLKSLDQETIAAIQSRGRQEETPEWMEPVDETRAEEPPLTSPVTEQAPSTEDTAAWLQGLEKEETAPSADIPSGDDTAIWFKTLDKPEEVTPEPTQAMPPEELPAWMQDIEQQKLAEEGAAASSEASEEIPEATEWMGAIEEEPKPVSQEVPRIDTGGLPSWLRGLDEEESERATFGAQEDLPAWLRDETGELVAEPTKIEPTRATDWQPVELEARQTEPEPEPEPAVSEPVAEQPAPEPVALPPQPEPVDVVSIIEEKITAAEPVAKQPAPPIRPQREPVRKVTGPLTDPILGHARGELSRNNLSGALENYGRLIKKGRLLEDIIYDLREASYRYPVEVDIWQSLGDAYMRANRLQDALDAYTKAEELLR
ncbi:MAG TPA: tetratricopeptide repeat protein [Anaerolineales bacterium]|nr:tetratricopeptide repeat protein [Anaerolineales bacterium]